MQIYIMLRVHYQDKRGVRMSGLYSTLNVAGSGLFAQQKAIDTTSHNIANASTDGYSRQRVTMEANSPYLIPSIENTGEAQVGRGVSITSIQRVRDSFLDYQIRKETSTKGTYDKRETYLGEVEGIINGTSDSGLTKLFSDFYSSWQNLSKDPQNSDTRTIVAQKSSTLTDELNHVYNQLQSLKTDCQSATKDQIFEINDKLEQLDKLNQQIKNVKISGNEPNDLMDQRDLLLDQLSSNFNINIDSEKLDGVDVSPVNSDGIKYPNLIDSYDNTNEKRFSYVSNIEKDSTTPVSGSGSSAVYTYKLTYYKKGDMTNQDNCSTVYVNMTEDQEKQVDENRVLWADKDGNAIGLSVDEASSAVIGGTSPGAALDFTSVKLFTPDNGEIKGTTSVQADIDTYTEDLNKMAKAFALAVNAIHSGLTNATAAGTASDGTSATPDKDYMPFFVNSSAAEYTTDVSTGQKTLSSAALNNVLGAEDGITAGNISVNQEIMTNVMNIKVRTNDDQYASESDNKKDGNSDGKRALAIAQLANSLMNIQNVSDTMDRADFFASSGANTGWAADSNGVKTVQNSNSGMTISNYFKDTVDKLAVQVQQASKNVTNQTTLLTNYTQTKASTSGVSIDEEFANLIQYQHAYQANAKIINTVDTLLDVVVNGLKK